MEKNNSFQKELPLLNLTKKEEKLIKNAHRYNTNIPFIIIIVVAVCHQWLKHLFLFKHGSFYMWFMIFNTIFYSALIWAALWTYFYQKKVSHLFDKLIAMVKSKKD